MLLRLSLIHIYWAGPDAELAEWGLDDVPVLKQNLFLAGLDENWPDRWYDPVSYTHLLSSVQRFREERPKSDSDAEKSPKCASRDFLKNFQTKWRSAFYGFCRIFHVQPCRKFLFLHDGNDGTG